MKEKSRLRLLFTLLFAVTVICLGLVAILFAQLLSLRQLKQENKLQKEKIAGLQAQVDSLKISYTPKQEEILKNVIDNPDISKLIKTKPVLGGKWGVWTDKSIKFLTEDKLLIIFDDGHLMGAMIVKVNDPQNIKTWKVLWSTML